MPTRYVIVGGGIVGLATAHRLMLDRPGADITVLEKENAVGLHQTGHNSGVIHAGVYYQPGSLKARLCKAGSRSMVDFCTEHGIPVKVCGKLIVATDEAEIPRLHALHERSVANGLDVRLLDGAGAREFEPHVSAVAALHVATTGITDFGHVCRVLAGLLVEGGARVRLGTRVTGIRPDRVARLAGVDPRVRIVPFRGEYYELRPDRRDLVKGLIYPVPDPQFPFLGVHFTTMVDGNVHAGPNAVLAFKREGYGWGNISLRDLVDSLGYRGMWHLGRRHWRHGLAEVRRSLSRKRFAASLARLVPEVTPADLTPSGAGVRAQAIRPDGTLVDDFLIVRQGRQVHVLNAPSPAATSSLEIARHIVAEYDPNGR